MSVENANINMPAMTDPAINYFKFQEIRKKATHLSSKKKCSSQSVNEGDVVK